MKQNHSNWGAVAPREPLTCKMAGTRWRTVGTRERNPEGPPKMTVMCNFLASQ